MWERMLHGAEESAVACALLLAEEFLFCSSPGVISKCESPTIVLKKNLTCLGLFDSLYTKRSNLTDKAELLYVKAGRPVAGC